MAGLDPAIHVARLRRLEADLTWNKSASMAGSSPAMTFSESRA
jgi:hypothetical protein